MDLIKKWDIIYNIERKKLRWRPSKFKSVENEGYFIKMIGNIEDNNQENKINFVLKIYSFVSFSSKI